MQGASSQCIHAVDRYTCPFCVSTVKILRKGDSSSISTSFLIHAGNGACTAGAALVQVQVKDHFHLLSLLHFSQIASGALISRKSGVRVQVCRANQIIGVGFPIAMAELQISRQYTVRGICQGSNLSVRVIQFQQISLFDPQALGIPNVNVDHGGA